MSVDITWRSLFRVIGALVLVWLWMTLAQLVLLVTIAALLAIALDPVVRWLEGKGLSRGPAAAVVGLVLFVLFAGFVVFAGASLASQGHLVGAQLVEAGRSVVARLPPALRQPVESGSLGSSVFQYAGRLANALVSALVVIVLAFILMIYLLIEGEQTYAWLVAFVPERRRRQVDETAADTRRVIFAYAVGNITTSIFAFCVVVVALHLLKVPAAFLLAVLAGIGDFVPVLGFIASSVPALVLALTVSPGTALAVAGVYLAYHLAENYYIGPLVYGNRLKLSNVVVVLAFAVGAEIAGVVGALVALPIAAVYPAIERIWLRAQLGSDVVKDHKKIAG
ncbi:MAG TPA: AI-2E family transporter [Vicinamibacterales bacterium]|nr:AI-2E family transporter [Vicinamibacterales bacterium]